MAKPGGGFDNGLVSMNQVHSIAAKLWTEKIPLTSNQPMQNQRQKHRPSGRQEQQRRITPVQLPSGHEGRNNIKSEYHFGRRGQSRNTPFSPLMTNSNWENSTPQVQSTFDSSSKKRAQIKSLPRKPPDIQNLDLFPPIGSTDSTPQRTTPSPTPRGRNQGAQKNPFAATLEESSFDPKYERNKMFTGVQKLQTEISCSSEIASSKPEAGACDPKSFKGTTASTYLKSDVGEKGRSAELFSQLTPAQIEELTRLSTSYSKSLDTNLCRSILAEFTFLCQLLVANNDDAVISLSNDQQQQQADILASLPPRVWFVTKVFEHQLPLISNISPDIIQMLNDFYAHRIPKHLRKKFEILIQKKTQEESKIRPQFRNVSACVTFQTETDGRSNFPHQRDCQDFGKQRDLFYAVREIWTSRQRQTHSPTPGAQIQSQGFDPAFPKVKQLFQLNSSPTNLSRLASLFLSQSLLDLNATNSNDTYDPGSMENILRIFQSNPSKYEKLRQRFHLSECVFDGNHSIPDPISFLKYFVNSCGSSEFRQHLIDHSIHEIQKLEAEFNNSPLEAMHQMRKAHLLAQILGFLYFLPYRDEEYKKPIGPINVEIYLQSQISLRLHQSFPMDLVSLLKKAYTQRKLIFSLSWIIEFLSRADQVTFHLPAYKPVLSLIASIYREILSTHSESPSSKGSTMNLQELFSYENKMLLRFMCGKLFGLTKFPDSYLFGGDVKHLIDFIPELTSLLPTIKFEEENIPLDLETSIGSTFLHIWFRPEMKQIITILSSNATVRGSISLEMPGIVKHIPAIPENCYGNSIHGSDNQSKNLTAGDLQIDLETQFFQIHPSSTKKTVDFISEGVASNFLKQLRNKILADIKTVLIDQRIFGHAGMITCKDEILKKLDMFSTERCRDAVSLLLGDVVSNSVLIMCQKICIKNTNERVLVWINQHVTKEFFPVVLPMLSDVPSSIKNLSPTDETLPLSPPSKPTGSLFLVLRALHNTIQLLHLGKPIDDILIDRILEDERLEKEKPWVTHRTIDLAMALITFSPVTLTPSRQSKFIKFWKKIWNEESNSFLRPRNFILLSMSSSRKITYQKLVSLIQNLLQVNLVTTTEIFDSCMTILRHDWPDTTKVCISEFLKELLPLLKSAEDKEVIDWIAWFCYGQGDDF